jgi:hypothetical protein
MVKFKKKHIVIIAILSFTWIISMIGITILRPFSEKVYWTYIGINYLITVILGTAGLGLATKTFSLKSKTGRNLGLLTIGMGFMTLGELVYLLNNIIYQEAQFPSIADLFYSIAFIFIIIALYYQFRLINIKMSLKLVLIHILIISIFLILVLWIEIIPILRRPISPDFSLGQKILGIWYPIINIIIITLIGLIFIKFKGGNISYAYSLLLCGFICEVIADTSYALLEILELYGAFNPIDIFWCVGYLLIGFGGIYQVYLVKE